MIKTLAPNVTKIGRASVKRDVVIDYPLEGEILSFPHYTLRVRAVPEAVRVEVQFGAGEWLPCREAMGFWWHDLTGLADGGMTVRACAYKGDGFVAETPVRRFKVRLQP